jgi:hypothetical protein
MKPGVLVNHKLHHMIATDELPDYVREALKQALIQSDLLDAWYHMQKATNALYDQLIFEMEKTK